MTNKIYVTVYYVTYYYDENGPFNMKVYSDDKALREDVFLTLYNDSRDENEFNASLDFFEEIMATEKEGRYYIGPHWGDLTLNIVHERNYDDLD